jgi:7,8-dihydroneopterin aldolase/epimerase/oxygenase
VDTIVLAEMAFHAYHGHLPEERTLGQRFLVDVEVDLDLRQAGVRDALEETVDYSALYATVQHAFSSPPCHLLEAAAERVADAVLGSQPRVSAVRVQVRKPSAPLGGAMLAYAAVRIERHSGSGSPT